MKTRLIAILITLTTIVSFPSCDLLINLFPPYLTRIPMTGERLSAIRTVSIGRTR